MAERGDADRTVADTAVGESRAQPEAPADRRTAPGGLIGRYIVRHRIAVGGMGEVYAGYDPELDRTVALKLVRADASSPEMARQRRVRLAREAQAQARVSHPNIVTVLDVGTFDDQVFIAMEYVDGLTLTDWLAAQPRAWRQIVQTFVAAGRGLHAAHVAGLIHRDFKPDNVLVGQGGRPRVTDFGIARAVDNVEQETKHADPRSDRLTRTGTLAGTPRYMAPEQHRGGAIDPRADQFSFCVSLYEALYDDHPFAAPGAELADLAEAVLAGTLRDEPKQSSVPTWVRRALVRGLAREPSERFRSMSALLHELERDPARTRRRVGMVAAFVLAVGLLAFVGLRRGDIPAAPPMCRGAVDRLAGVWDDDVKASIDTAFLATNAPHAAMAARRVRTVLDGYANRWVSMRNQACAATRVTGEQSSDLMDLRVACMDRRLAELRALVRVFTEADEAGVKRSALVATSLTPIAGCADVAALTSPTPTPEEPRARARVDELRDVYVRAQALNRASRYPEAQPLLEQLVVDASEVGYRPFEADVRLALGHLYMMTGKYAAAATQLEDAVLAARAGGNITTEAAAWTKLLHNDGEYRAKPDDARRDERYAVAVVERLGHGGDAEARLNNTRCAVNIARGALDEALTQCRRALAIWESAADSPDVFGSAVALMNLGNALRQHNRAQEAAQVYERCVGMLERELGTKHTYTSVAMANYGTALMDMGRHDEARALFERSLAIDRELTGTESRSVAMTLNHLGSSYRATGDTGRALEFHAKSLAMRKKLLGQDHPDVSMSLTNIGAVYTDRKEWGKAIGYYKQSLAVIEKTQGPDSISAAITRYNIAEVLVETHAYAAALAHYRKARAVLGKRLGEDDPDTASVDIGIAKVHILRNAPASALKLLDRAAPGIAKATAPDQAIAAFVRAQALWLEPGNHARALEFAAHARDSLAAEGKAAESALAEVDAWLAEHR